MQLKVALAIEIFLEVNLKNYQAVRFSKSG